MIHRFDFVMLNFCAGDLSMACHVSRNIGAGTQDI